jgi:hypothetical protein
MSIGKFHEVRIKKQLLLERAQEHRKQNPELSEESDDEKPKVQSKTQSTQLKAVDAFGTGFLTFQNIEASNDVVEEFGNLSLGIKPVNHMTSVTRERQNEMKDFYSNDKENFQKYFGNQKQVDKMIKVQIMKDSVKQLANKTLQQ